MSEIDFSDFVTIKITRVAHMGEPIYWEVDVTDKNGEDIGGGTAPSFYGLVDMAIDMARERNDIDNPEWSRFDANGENR